MKRDIVWTTKFKKDYKLAIKRHMDIGLLDDIIRALSRGRKIAREKQRPRADRRLGGASGMPHSAGLAAYLPY